MFYIRLSELFTKTSKTLPADETSRNAQLLIQAGYVHKVMAGVYAYTPLGLRVLENIKQVVREEMNSLGAQELIMSSLQRPETWEITDRWDDDKVDIWFKTRLKDESVLGLAWSHEEPIIEMMKHHIESYKDLPANVYQFQSKLRNELRAKSGVMRGREFIMKDMYSCSIDAEQHEKFYNDCITAYNKVYERLGIGDDTYVTFASGGAFTKFSHEFQTVCEAGEDIIYLHKGKNLAVNEEVLDDESLEKLGVKKEELEKVKSAEVGNIFNFGTHKSEQTGFAFTNESGEKQYVHLGSYGIGITRLIGVIAEKFADDKGLVWPDAVAPAKVQLIALGADAEVSRTADGIYDTLQNQSISVIYDDRDGSAGEKFADADLLGTPVRLVVSKKTLGQEVPSVELKKRSSSEAEFIPVDALADILSSKA